MGFWRHLGEARYWPGPAFVQHRFARGPNLFGQTYSAKTYSASRAISVLTFVDEQDSSKAWSGISSSTSSGATRIT